MTSRRLRHYFEVYQVTKVTEYPLADILHNPEATGRIAKWAMEFGALHLDFKPRTAIKSQALVDFMAEGWGNQIPTPANKAEHWTMYLDGSLKVARGGAGVLFISPTGEKLKYVLQILFEVSNNEAEYEALLHVFGDSKLVIQQVNKEGDINNKIIDNYVAEVRKLENKFAGLKIHQVVCDNNVGVDVLSKLGSTRAQVPLGVFVQELHH